MNSDEKIEIVFKKLGEHITKLRETRNISIKELSEKTGIRKEYLRKIEKGTAYGVRLEGHLVKIAKALNIKMYDLLDCE